MTRSCASENHRGLVVGQCDGRALANHLSRAGFPTLSYTPESILELVAGNDRIAELYSYLHELGLQVLVKTEKVSIRDSIADKDSVVIVPFYENIPILQDTVTQCCFFPRFRIGSYYDNLFRQLSGERFVRVDPDRDTYHQRFGSCISELANEFPGVAFVVLDNNYDALLKDIAYVHNVPYVSNTFEEFAIVTHALKGVMETISEKHANVFVVSMGSVFGDIVAKQSMSLRDIFPFFLPSTNPTAGYRRDIAHISDVGFRALAHAVLRKLEFLVDDTSALHNKNTHRVSQLSEVSNRYMLWANRVGQVINSDMAQDAEKDITRELVALFEEAPNNPGLIPLIYVYFSYVQTLNAPRYMGQAFKTICGYFMSKDLEYGAWKRFYQMAIDNFSRIMGRRTDW